MHKCDGRLNPSRKAADKNAEAKALLAKAYPERGATSGSSGSIGVKAAGVAKAGSGTGAGGARKRQVELMRLRHRATAIEAQFEGKGAASVPAVDKRRFFKVAVGGGEKEFWVTKVRELGRDRGSFRPGLSTLLISRIFFTFRKPSRVDF